jgi:uncharacterized protein YeaO (DUF488 family)
VLTRPASSKAGYRILIYRLWPRDVSRANARLGEWDEELAPTAELRAWFGHTTRAASRSSGAVTSKSFARR